jgi:hypothetical protein
MNSANSDANNSIEAAYRRGSVELAIEIAGLQ